MTKIMKQNRPRSLAIPTGHFLNESWWTVSYDSGSFNFNEVLFTGMNVGKRVRDLESRDIPGVVTSKQNTKFTNAQKI